MKRAGNVSTPPHGFSWRADSRPQPAQRAGRTEPMAEPEADALGEEIAQTRCGLKGRETHPVGTTDVDEEKRTV